MNRKKMVTIIVIVLILLTAIMTLVTYNKVKNEDVKDVAITKDEKVNGLNFTDTTFNKEEGQYVLQMKVTNPSKKEIDLKEVDIVLKDKNGNEIATLLGYIGEPMKANETRTMTINAAMDLSTVKSKTIKAKK